MAPTATARISVHLLRALFIGYGTGEFTSQQLLAGLNNYLGAGNELTQAEIDDLTDMAAQFDGQANATLKLVYLNRIELAGIGAEMGAINETKFRSILGI